MNKSAVIGRWTYWGLSFIVVLVALRWVPEGVRIAIPGLVYHLADREVVLYTHMIASVLPMALIPLQLSTKFRRRNPKAHRILGRVALVGTYLGGLTLLPLVPYINTPLWGQAGFVIGALLWMSSASIGMYFIVVKRDQRRHRWFMMITAAVVFGAATQRLWQPIMVGVGFTVPQAYGLSAWNAWLFNLLAFFLWQYRHKIRALWPAKVKTRDI